MGDRYPQHPDRYGRDDRGFAERAGDEVRSWFGDDDAARRRQIDERERGAPSRWGQERSYSSDRPYGGGEYGFDRRGPGEGEWRGGYREYGPEYRGGEAGWRGEPDWRQRSTARDYSGVSWGATGGHAEDRMIARTGAGIESGYMNFHRPDAPDWRAIEYDREGYGNRYGYDRGPRWGTREWGTEIWRVPGPHTGRGPRGYQRSDERIREEVNDRLTAHGLIDATDVECKVENGEVLLTGFVDSRAAKRAAEDAADDVPGVREVHNHLRIRTNAPDHEGVGRTSVLGLTERQTQTAQTRTETPDTSRSRTRS
jgi:hypothetical protein